MSKRDYIPLKEQLAAALSQIPGPDGQPAIPHEHAKLMTAEQVISLFHRDHYPIRKEDGGPDVHWNLYWRFIAAHRVKTAKIDIPQSAKGKRLRKREAQHRAAMAIETPTEPIPEPRRHRRIPSRPFPKQHRPLRSRNTLRRRP